MFEYERAMMHAKVAVFDDHLAVTNDLSVGDHVTSDGTIWLNVKHIVMATFTPLGFDSFIDRVAIVVE